MRRSAKTGSPGFTLLEMIIALFIMMLLLGMAVMGTRNILADEEIREAARELQIFAKTARKEALNRNQPLELLLDPRSWKLVSTPNPEKSDKPSLPAMEYRLPEKIQWKIKRSHNAKWETPKDMSWLFSSSGLCAPYRFRFERNDSWMEFSFHPLTANPQQEDFHLP